MINLNELEDYVPGNDPEPKVMKTNDKMLILRKEDKVLNEDNEEIDLEELFEDYDADEDSEGMYLKFNYPTKHNNITSYEFFDNVLLVHSDGRKVFIQVYELHGLFSFKNMIIIHGHETIHIVDTTDFSIHREHTR